MIASSRETEEKRFLIETIFKFVRHPRDKVKGCHDIQHNDIKRIGTQHNAIQSNSTKLDAQPNLTLT